MFVVWVAFNKNAKKFFRVHMGIQKCANVCIHMTLQIAIIL